MGVVLLESTQQDGTCHAVAWQTSSKQFEMKRSYSQDTDTGNGCETWSSARFGAVALGFVRCLRNMFQINCIGIVRLC